MHFIRSMKGNLLIAVLTLVASSSAALADRPRYDDRHGRYDRGNRAHRNGTSLARRVLANTSTQTIGMKQQVPYKFIRIEPARGAPVITYVVVEYADKSTERFRVGERLRTDETIRLGSPLPVRQIFVHADPRFGGSYNVVGF